jgi:N-hydroxyarylamine O-acetyltransferase
MNVEAYLNRINYHKEPKIDLITLSELQKTHLQTVPFENLDIHYGRNITLDIERIYTKIIKNKRGGFCYELNGLFYHLLKTIGFDVKIMSARVYSQKTKQYGKEYDHLAINVKIDSTNYLVDVGFGKFALKPLLIELGIPQKDDLGIFQFDKHDDDYLKVGELTGEEFIPQYIFKTKTREFQEFTKMCDFHQTSEESHFTKQKVVSLLTQSDRITLTNEQFKISNNKGKVIEELNFKGAKKFEELLKKHFAITLN